MPPPSSISEQQSVCYVQNRKRLNPYDTTQDSPPAKKIKSTSAVRVTSNFPPKFWDKLSKVWLTPRALREKDRRNGAQPPATVTAARLMPTNLARFARRGGPDLRHLRGYPEPKQAARMSSNRPSTSSSRRTQSTKATSVSSRAKRSSAYDKDFEQNLIDHNIYPKGFQYSDDDSIPEPSNLDDIVQALAVPRASLSPSRFSRAAFKKFALANDRVISEGNVMARILPKILGDADFPSEGNLPFTNLDSITDGTTVDAVPDLYDGSHAKEISKAVRQDLSKMITPTSHARAPVAPNFFVEAKAPRGGADVANRQACMDGAIGARVIDSLQNYDLDNHVYDNNAHTFSCTYHAGTGTLQLYAHHVTSPATEGERPEYHMTQLKAYAVTSDRETFIQGATASRNARDLARQQRETFIRDANARAANIELAATASNLCNGHGDNQQDDFIRPESSTWQDTHDDLQQHIAETCGQECEGTSEKPAIPRHDHTWNQSQHTSQDAALGTDDPSKSLVSSPASSFGTDAVRPKRSRQSLSSPTQGSRSSKSRSRFTTIRQPAVLFSSITEPGPIDADVSHQVEIYGHKEKNLLPESRGSKDRD